ncbi:MAG: 50S ribosomal protein L9 [Actinomycetia bacterium]|nr:50S ribosomal protein L9 [Actinomycetes bacterium]
MKVILTQEIKGRGGEGDVVEVKRGYAVNFLFPKNMAIKATEGNLKQLELRRHNIEKREVSRLSDANKAVEYLTDKEVVIPMKVGEEGRLFGSVTAPMIADALHEIHGVEVDRRKIEVKAPIKELGEHHVDINVYRELKAPILVKVVSDGEAIDIGLTAEQAAELVDAEQAAELQAKEEGEEMAVDEKIVADEAADTLGTEDAFSAPMPGQEEVLAEGAPVAEELAAEADSDEWVQV